MHIAVTGLRMVSGAQMRFLQAKSGLFINEDTLILELDNGDEDTAEWVSLMPPEHIRRASEAEVQQWHDTQERLWDAFERRWAARRTGEPMPKRTVERLRAQFREITAALSPTGTMPKTSPMITQGVSSEVAQGYAQKLLADGSLYPPLAHGTRVITTKSRFTPEEERRNFYPEAIARRRWGVLGVITNYHNSHGLYYEVVHDDDIVGATSGYDPEELDVVN